MTAFEQIRRDLNDYPNDLVNWEAACLKDMANLLESLERARSEWQSLSAQLAEARTLLAQERAIREELACARREAEDLRARSGRAAVAEAAAAAALERLAETEGALVAARDRAGVAEAELARTRERLATAQRERDVLAENEQGCVELKAESADLRARLKRAERARDELKEERERTASLERELERARERAVVAEGAEERLAAAKAESEAQMVLACDLRVRVNRLERERDEALAYGRKKLKKVIEKVHEALDEAGAPRGDDLSYGERLRWLVARFRDGSAGP
jgi:chromosome segregation ATPase